MTFAVESLLFLLGGIVLAVVLIQAFGRPGASEKGSAASTAPSVRLVRLSQPAQGFEETRLLINGQPILSASSQGLRLAEYAEEVERLEAVATRIARALGVAVELARLEPGSGEGEAAIPIAQLPAELPERHY
jgi:hypothetical protein